MDTSRRLVDRKFAPEPFSRLAGSHPSECYFFGAIAIALLVSAAESRRRSRQRYIP